MKPPRKPLFNPPSITNACPSYGSLFALDRVLSIGLVMLLTCVIGIFLYLDCFRSFLRATMTGTELLVTR